MCLRRFVDALFFAIWMVAELSMWIRVGSSCLFGCISWIFRRSQIVFCVAWGAEMYSSSHVLSAMVDCFLLVHMTGAPNNT